MNWKIVVAMALLGALPLVPGRVLDTCMNLVESMECFRAPYACVGMMSTNQFKVLNKAEAEAKVIHDRLVSAEQDVAYAAAELAVAERVARVVADRHNPECVSRLALQGVETAKLALERAADKVVAFTARGIDAEDRVSDARKMFETFAADSLQLKTTLHDIWCSVPSK